MATLPPSQDLGLFLERVALPPGWQVVYEPVVESTMDLAREAARRGWPDRSVFVCDHQTAGRGREGRRWEAPPGLGLLFTVLLRSAGSPLEHTMLVSVAVCEAIEHLLQLEPSIKWPNDLLLDGSKLAGVLAESHTESTGGYALVGCGLNVNQDAEQLGVLDRPATSLKLAAGRDAHRGELLVLCLERLSAWLAVDPGELSVGLRQAWQSRLWARGRLAMVRDACEDFPAVIEGAAADGALLVRLANGQVRRVLAGEILL